MKQDAEQESSLLYWEIQDDTTRKHRSLKQTLFYLICFLIAGFGLYQLVQETPVAGVGSMNELEVGSAPPHYELESEVGATLTINGSELGVGDENLPEEDTDGKDGVEEKFFFHNEFFDAGDMCQGFNCGPDEGSCLLLPQGDGSPSCIVDQKYLAKAACNNDKGVWCENSYRDSDVADDDDEDEEDEEDEVVEGVNPLEMSVAVKGQKFKLGQGVVEGVNPLEMSVAVKGEKFKLSQGVQVPVGGYIGGSDWCDCGKKGDLQLYPIGFYENYSQYVKPDNKRVKIELTFYVRGVKWRCTDGGSWQLAWFAGDWMRMLKVRFKHAKKNCPGPWRKKRSGRIYWG